ncbi:MAG: efflux RND transporter permease subunit, partial [Flexistipes sinusarabici]
MFDFFYKRPQLLYSLLAGFIFLGLIGFMKMPRNFFPDAEYPQVFVITQVPGATAETVSSTVSKVLEEEIYTLANIRSVSSTNIAGMSVVRAEFDYSKELGEAAVYVNNALNRVRSRLPENAAPSIYTSGAFNAPVDVFTLTSADDSMTLSDVRKIAESDVKRELLKNKYIGNVEIFGGYKGAVSVDLDPMKMSKYSLVAADVIKTISNTYKDIPMGFLQSEDNYITVNFYGEEVPVSSLRKLPVKSNVKLKDVAKISWGHEKNRSAYVGNARSGIAVIVKRPPGGSIVDASNAAREIVDKLKNRFDNISFSISDTQKNLVDTSLRNMFSTLKLTIIIVVFVILLFLANIKATLASAITIPMIFFTSLGVIWITGGELNLIVMTAIVLALGIVVDNSVVVIENIERYFSDLNKPINKAVKEGTKEVMLPIFSGTLTTVIAVFPLMFVGGFPEKIFKPLASTLIIALSVSYFLAVTFIPRIFILFYKNGARQWKIEKVLSSFYFKTFDKL